MGCRHKYPNEIVLVRSETQRETYLGVRMIVIFPIRGEYMCAGLEAEGNEPAHFHQFKFTIAIKDVASKRTVFGICQFTLKHANGTKT